MRPPTILSTATSRQFWREHAPNLVKNGTLNALTKTSFAVLCRTFADYIEAKDDRWRSKYLKHYYDLAKPFGLIPHAAQSKANQDQAAEVAVGAELDGIFDT